MSDALMEAKLVGIYTHLRAAYPLLAGDADIIEQAVRELAEMRKRNIKLSADFNILNRDAAKLDGELAEARGNYERMHADKMRLLDEAIDIRAQVEALTNDAEAHRSYKQAMNLAKRAIEALTAERDAVLARWHEPVSPGALQRLGERLSRILSEDDWNNIEPFLLPLEAQLSRLLADNGRLAVALTSARTELYSATVQMAASDDQIICNTVRKALHIVSTALEDQ